MSTEYKTLEAHAREGYPELVNEEVRCLSFFGGNNRGRCFQFSQGGWQNTETVKLTKEQVVAAMAEMAQWLGDA